MINEALIPAAGLGTRLLSATKEQPKEMLPLFSPGPGEVCVKPLLQIIFEQLYEVGTRGFVFIIGKGKRSIEDHFTQDNAYLSMLNDKGKMGEAGELGRFYRKLDDSHISWVTQPEPRGFGDAVHKAKSTLKDRPFIVHAGDTYILSENHGHLRRLNDVFSRYEADAVLLLKRLKDTRGHGVVHAERVGDVFQVTEAVEKPEKHISDLAIMPVYIFKPLIFTALEETRIGYGSELQLTDAIQTLIQQKRKVYALELDSQEIRLDIGTPQSYWRALKDSYDYSLKIINSTTRIEKR